MDENKFTETVDGLIADFEKQLDEEFEAALEPLVKAFRAKGPPPNEEKPTDGEEEAEQAE